MEMVIQRRLLPEVEQMLNELGDNNNSPRFSTNARAGIIGIIGTGLNFNSETALRVFQALEKLEIEPQMLQVSELKISWMMPEEKIDATVKQLYKELVGRR
jgi:aspartokinase